jgi:NitT/TauT family transport system substrate-binding protein
MQRFTFARGTVAAVALLLLVLFAGCAAQRNDDAGNKPVRLAYMPNVTHAQAVIGAARGDFQKALGERKLETYTFNAGPTIVEGIYAGHVDIGYVGPSPALNGFLNSKGDEIRVISGSASNGVLVVGNRKRGITRLDQLAGKRIATPQLGNTQDISAKSFVVEKLGRRLAERGGDTEVIPFMNPDIELLFQKDQLDAAWLPEPWGSRLVDKGLVNVIAEEKDLWPAGRFALTNIVARRAFLEANPEAVRQVLQAHVQLTRELQEDPMSFVTLLDDELKRITGKSLPTAVMQGSLKHVVFDTAIDAGSFVSFFEKGRALGLVRGERLELDRLLHTRILDEISTGT